MLTTFLSSPLAAFQTHRVRSLLWQVLAVIILAVAAGWMITNLRHNLEVRNIGSGFDFLGREAGLPIAETLVEYSPTSTYARALWVGVVNTLWVSAWGIVLATILGTAIGIARLSENWLLARLASVYVEFFRDLPLLLQLLLWYTLLQGLPSVRQALEPVPGVYLSNRGMNLPSLVWSTELTICGLMFVAGVVTTLYAARRAARLRLEDGKARPIWPISVGATLVLPLLTGVLLGAKLGIDWPQTGGFNIRGGLTLSPEFFALLLGLVIYNAAFIAEIVRSGIQSVGSGQREATVALGLKPGQALRWIIFPQAIRVMVPPMTSQYLNLAKNSSLAVAIGYQDIVSIANTSMNQTGQAIELVGIIMAVYLSISLSISLFMNIYNRRMALVER